MSELFEGLAYLGNWVYWLALGVAILAAVLVGLVSGVSATIVIATALPFVVANVEDALIGIVMLATMGSASMVMRSVAPVLFGLPGSSNYVTFLEGNQLARRGQAAHALGAAFTVSAIGGITGVVIFALALLIGAPLMDLLLGTFEGMAFVAVALFALVIVALLNSEAMLKGLAAASLGLLLGTSGLDPFEVPLRSALDGSDLWRSFFVTAAAIGVLGLTEVIDLTVARQPLSLRETPDSRSEVFRGVCYGLGRWRTAMRQGLFGALVGVVPGIGAGTMHWLSYALGIFLTKDKREFGRGSLDGLLLAESAVGAGVAAGGTPTVLFGIPGSITWVFVIVALLSYGIAPGPRILEDHRDIVVMVALSLVLAMPAVAVIGVLVTGRLAKLARVPYPVIGGIIVPVLFLATFTSTESLIGIYVVAAAAVLGLLMKWCEWPRAPFVMGLLASHVLNWATDALTDTETVEMTIWSVLWPALAALPVAVVAAVIFKRGRVGVSAARPEEPDESTGSSGEPGYIESDGTAAAGTRRVVVTPQSLFTMAVIVAGIWGLYAAAAFPLSDMVFPLLMSLAVVVLGGAQLFFDLRRSKPGTIMDIGIRSLGMADARRTALLMAAMVTVFIALIPVIGVRYATILFPLGPALLFLEGRTRWIGAGVGVALLAAFNVALVLIEQHAP